MPYYCVLVLYYMLQEARFTRAHVQYSITYTCSELEKIAWSLYQALSGACILYILTNLPSSNTATAQHSPAFIKS